MATISRRTKKASVKRLVADAKKVSGAFALLLDDPRNSVRVKNVVSGPALSSSSDPVNHPPHYNAGKIEVIDFIEDQRLDFHLGNVVKYIARAAHKGSELADLRKAAWYLNRRIELGKAQGQ